MIQYNPKNWFGHITRFHKSDTLRILLPEMFIMAVVAAAIVFAEQRWMPDSHAAKNTLVVHSLIGFVISLMLVFRTNSAYDRWWEGRKHWGAMVNNTRNLALRIDVWVPESDTELRTFWRKMIPNFPFALKEHLRDGVIVDELEDVEGLKSVLEGKEHKPNAIAGAMYHKAKYMLDSGMMSKEEFITMDKELKSMTDILGACERIRNTPIPFAYSMFIKKFIFLYVLTLPLGLVPMFGYWTIPISVFIFYVLVSMEVIAEEIEDPFGRDSNDLPTDGLSVKIRGNVQEILGKE